MRLDIYRQGRQANSRHKLQGGVAGKDGEDVVTERVADVAAKHAHDASCPRRVPSGGWAQSALVRHPITLNRQ